MKQVKLFNFKSQLSISDPEPITRINATEITDSAVTLMWDSPRGEYNAFEVQYLNTEGMFLMYKCTGNSFARKNWRALKKYVGFF